MLREDSDGSALRTGPRYRPWSRYRSGRPTRSHRLMLPLEPATPCALRLPPRRSLGLGHGVPQPRPHGTPHRRLSGSDGDEARRSSITMRCVQPLRQPQSAPGWIRARCRAWPPIRRSHHAHGDFTITSSRTARRKPMPCGALGKKPDRTIGVRRPLTYGPRGHCSEADRHPRSPGTPSHDCPGPQPGPRNSGLQTVQRASPSTVRGVITAIRTRPPCSTRATGEKQCFPRTLSVRGYP